MSDPQEFEWYTSRAIDSRDALISIVGGPASIGKTFDRKVQAIKLGVETERQSMWIRRSLTELNPAKDGFFDAVGATYPHFDFRVQGNTGQVRTDGDTWRDIVRFAALSVAYQWKGTEFPTVDDMVYDECFAPPGGRYLVDELEKLRRLWITVNRGRVGRDGRAKTRVRMLGNPLDLDNPYFLEWRFNTEREWQWGYRAKGDVILHLVDADRYVKRVTETIYGKAIGTAQLDYAGGEYFRPDAGYVVDKRPGDSRPFVNLVTLDGEFGAWQAADYSAMFITPGRLAAPEVPTIALEKLAVRPGARLGGAKDYWRNELKRHYERGSMYFVTPAALIARIAVAR